MGNEEKHAQELEKRITALEVALNDGQTKMCEIIESWESVLMDFAQTFNLLDDKFYAEKVKQKEMERSIMHEKT